MLIIGSCVIVCSLTPFNVQGHRLRRISGQLSTWHMLSVFVVVITSRAAGKTISSWQHIEATRLSHSRKLGIGHRNHCHYHVQKTKHKGCEGCKGWSTKLLGKTTCWVLVFSHHTLHLTAQPTVRCIYQFLLGDLFFSLSLWIMFPILSTDAYWALAIWKSLFWELGK